MSADVLNLTLSPYPGTVNTAVASLRARITVGTNGGLRITYQVEGDMARLRVPEATAAERGDGLWRHTCFEVFVARTDAAAYREFNLSPSGQWAHYAFSGYRERDPWPNVETAPLISTRRTSHEFILIAELSADNLPSPATPLLLGLASVIEAIDGTLSYWSLAHPAARPDFHHRDAWVLPWPPATQVEPALERSTP
ncbi:MAG: DOMON-like domain-containing protein [Thiotrichales bacterium]